MQEIISSITDDLVQGNPYAWILFTILAFGIAWRTNSGKVVQFFNWIKHLFVPKKTHRHSEIIMAAIVGEVISAWDIEYDTDKARNALYRWIVCHLFDVVKDGISDFYEKYRAGIVSPQTFCDPARHKEIFQEIRLRFRDDFVKKLKANGWPEDKIALIRENTTLWFGGHFRLFDKYLVVCSLPRQFMQNWLWLIGETIRSAQSYGMNLNGEIAGLMFNGIEIQHVEKGQGYSKERKASI